ncbi:MAG TPA: DUF1810 domain-containing protein [Streptosporangiaceae bacterium]|jgi:uncharacterized protein (DUF1810 family)
MTDSYRLERFVTAQDADGTFQHAVAELQAGRKRGHWMWFIFPQIAGLGQSSMSREFAISSLAEAQAYLRHPVLGPRLTQCAQLVSSIDGKTAAEIFGAVDAMKLRSCMTLFMSAAPDEPAFRSILGKYFDGSPDENTISLL